MVMFRYLNIKTSIFSLLFLITGANPVKAVSPDRDIPFIERIIINNDSALIISELSGTSGLLLSKPMVFDQRHNSLLFELSSGDTLTYSFFLNGFDEKWGEWLPGNYKEYTNLPAGSYELHVRYRDMEDNTGEIEMLSFRVLPLWYFSGLAIGLYICLAILIIWALYGQLTLRFARTQYMLEQIINKRTEDLIIEKEKTENLLANVLPKNTASEIIEKGKATKMKYNFVTVLFSDIQGFTKIAEEMNPEILIDELDKFFFTFDSVVENLGIEKIKTIGDAYMCAGGIPEKNRTNPVEVILAALEMQTYMKKLKEDSQIKGIKYWDIRIGIHTGTVVAGVVGHKKLSYDIWGDTVNTASRMESHGAFGKIHVTEDVKMQIDKHYIFEKREIIDIKGKGEMQTYFLNGKNSN